MVQTICRHEPDLILHSASHAPWVDQIRLAWQSESSRAQAAALIVDGPMEQCSDRASSEAQRRQRTLACAILEAAIHEAQNPVQGQEEDGGGSCESVSDKGLPDVSAIQDVLRDWLKLGGWRAQEKSPLTEIGRMIERSSETEKDAVATRLGLLVPFWSSLALSRYLCSAPIDPVLDPVRDKPNR